MREIVIVAFDGVQSLDVTGPLEVFAAATAALGDGAGGYRVRVLTAAGAPITASSGLGLLPHGALESASARIDTLVIAGGDGTAGAMSDPALVPWVRATAPRCRRVTSVCSGAFLLAEAGLLDGRRATTHWSVCALLARRYPAVTVEPEPIYVRDGDVWTSAGVTAGMDLALALVEEDHGRELALQVARRLVLFLRRPANQAQFSAQLSAQLADRAPLRDLQAWMADHPGADLSVEAMARRAAMSPRHFARAFRAEVGMTPARYVERVRLEAARRRLEESDDAVERVAAECGFGTAETMRRTFVRALDVPPAEYRRRFRSPAVVTTDR
jgi:transcriptional regulator GlxA family with amidase domain